ncbi:helix-turn-helix transcriptional regulator [Lysinibacillus sp. NPDC094403]|uniref:helix-turn-helix transcriptional regulator n=1 Tax=Lysinibacillus sp. NPDC094403 TaxID=3390581 RepID=UPI003D076F05
MSKRTIYRDIESLNLAGIPIVSYPGQGGGLGILANYKIDKKFFSIDELQTILIGLDALNNIHTENNIAHRTPQGSSALRESEASAANVFCSESKATATNVLSVRKRSVSNKAPSWNGNQLYVMMMGYFFR